MVFPGIDEVIANLLWRVSMLIRLDFPTLERPMKAYSGFPSMGHFDISVLLITKRADFISIFFICSDCFFLAKIVFLSLKTDICPFFLTIFATKNIKEMSQEYPSVLLERAVSEFTKLPGVGRKTATRLVLHLLRRQEGDVESFADAIVRLKREVKYCRECHSISDTDICPVCANPSRDHSTICVVENIQDVMAVENTMQYRGVYHVLGGVISPMDGISPSDLNIGGLVERVASGEVKEVILALSSTMEGDTTNFYIYRKLSAYGVKLSVIARGIAVGDELEYADEVTLGRSIMNRTPFVGKTI